MSDPNTLRILEIDGGGERGYLALCWLQKFLEDWGIDEATNPLWKNFDVICGTSVGGIMALSLASGLLRVNGANPSNPNDPTAMKTFFRQKGPYIFTTFNSGIPPIDPSKRPSTAEKVALILADIPFYQSSGSSAAEYGAGLMRATIQETFGSRTLQDLKTKVIIPTFEDVTNTFVVCSNLNYPEFLGQNELISNVAIATSAAPVYFPPLVVSSGILGKLNGTYIDGGVYQNNPAQFGRTLAQMIKPNANRVCMLSVGTGVGEYGFESNDLNAQSGITDPRIDPEIRKWISEAPNITPSNNGLLHNYCKKRNIVSPNAFNTIQAIFELFSIASTGGQESIAKAQALESKYTLSQFYYYRFQPNLDLTKNTELDNTDDSILTYYEDLANTSYADDKTNIDNFRGHLTA